MASEAIQLIEEAEPGVPLPEARADEASFGTDSDGKAEMDAYLRQVRMRLAKHAPKGVAGARDCAVEFQLSRAGEVVFVGIRTSSGSRVYDRRCLKSVTSAVPFPAAPRGATAADLSFTITMKQKR